VAEIVHGLSRFRRGPFIAVDCAAFPEMMLAVELFGCAPGLRVELPHGLPGKLELARGGTLLIEHVEQMPRWIQGRLLRFLETGLVERMGGTGAVPVQVRIMASTTGCLSDTASGRRSLIDDLCGGIPLKVPPLRQRGDDIELLSLHFLGRANREFGKQIQGFSPAARALLEAYTWPGNLRELNGAIRSAALAADRVITSDHFPSVLREACGWAASKP
jgi:DNA-binding NtrC family response regulator